MDGESGSANGYEYHYRFWVDDEIIHRYSHFKIRDDVRFLFEMRTNFRIKDGDVVGGGNGEIIDSERYEIGSRADQIDELWWPMLIRLQDYWFSYREISAFGDAASAFAKAAAAAGNAAAVIPIAVEMDVCTVRQAGEAAADRAIRSADLFPLWLYDRNAFAEVEKPACQDRIPFLRLDFAETNTRMGRLHFFSRFMEECMICLRPPTVGAEITVLEKFCGHAFHYGCIVRHLLTHVSCPLCAHPILTASAISSAERFVDYFQNIFVN